jgi:hypothetical protein
MYVLFIFMDIVQIDWKDYHYYNHFLKILIFVVLILVQVEKVKEKSIHLESNNLKI